MGKIKRSFDVQFKTRVCEAVRSGMMTAAEACRESGQWTHTGPLRRRDT
jgi:hypothetical protein